MTTNSNFAKTLEVSAGQGATKSRITFVRQTKDQSFSKGGGVTQDGVADSTNLRRGVGAEIIISGGDMVLNSDLIHAEELVYKNTVGIVEGTANAKSALSAAEKITTAGQPVDKTFGVSIEASLAQQQAGYQVTPSLPGYEPADLPLALIYAINMYTLQSEEDGTDNEQTGKQLRDALKNIMDGVDAVENQVSDSLGKLFVDGQGSQLITEYDNFLKHRGKLMNIYTNVLFANFIIKILRFLDTDMEVAITSKIAVMAATLLNINSNLAWKRLGLESGATQKLQQFSDMTVNYSASSISTSAKTTSQRTSGQNYTAALFKSLLTTVKTKTENMQTNINQVLTENMYFINSVMNTVNVERQLFTNLVNSIQFNNTNLTSIKNLFKTTGDVSAISSVFSKSPINASLRTISSANGYLIQSSVGAGYDEDTKTYKSGSLVIGAINTDGTSDISQRTYSEMDVDSFDSSDKLAAPTATSLNIYAKSAGNYHGTLRSNNVILTDINDDNNAELKETIDAFGQAFGYIQL